MLEDFELTMKKSVLAICFLSFCGSCGHDNVPLFHYCTYKHKTQFHMNLLNTTLEHQLPALPYHLQTSFNFTFNVA